MIVEYVKEMVNHQRLRVFLFITALLSITFNMDGLVIAEDQTNGFSSPSKDNIERFNEWASIAQGRYISPAKPTKTDDLVSEWQGADGNKIKLVVRQPVGLKVRKKVVVEPIALYEDARPYFENAIAKARKNGANTLNISAGTYNFLSVESRYRSHFLLENLKDFIIEGNGATLNFNTDAPGLLIQQSQRVRVENLTLNFKVRSTSIGKITVNNGKKLLLIDEQFPVSEKNKISQVVELDPAQRRFIVGGVRLIFPPELEAPQYQGTQSYVAKQFDKLNPGTRLLVIHNWYSAPAIKIDGFRNDLQTEDITIAGVTVHSTPGMAMTVTGLKRGLALIDSDFAPDKQNQNDIASPSWDAMHVLLGGGDILIARNHFAFMADDAINLNNPIHSIRKLDNKTNKVVLANSSRFILKSDSLAFFDNEGGYIGKANVISDPANLGLSNYEVELDAIPQNVSDKSIVRDIDLISSRFLIKDNVFEDISGHGVLAQIPNGLIVGNTFKQLSRNAIRLLTSPGQWKEGVGAFNIAVRDNTIQDGGLDSGMGIPWAAITAYGGARDNKLSTTLVNENIEVTNNRLQNIRQGCVTIANGRKVKVKNNACESKANGGKSQNVQTIMSLEVEAN